MEQPFARRQGGQGRVFWRSVRVCERERESECCCLVWCRCEGLRLEQEFTLESRLDEDADLRRDLGPFVARLRCMRVVVSRARGMQVFKVSDLWW